ncbi:hypothetical protein [Sciscionella marina]|uniref:hypothetical protein n=1 Tax=Sciscionella marina TaxID=508770 RepID=UPI000365A62D|nr:hypothetical protein [Sciscionella marina]
MSPALIVLLVACAYGAWRFYRHRRKAGPAPRPGRRTGRKRNLLAVVGIVAVQLVLLTPSASAAGCGEAPNPERPGAGMVGAIDPPALDHGDPIKGNYGKYGYAGTRWNVYQAPATPCIPDPTATIDTWAGNQLFDMGKNVVGATNSLHYAMLSQDSMLAPLDDAVENGAKTFFNNVYVQWFGVAALILAVMLFRYIWNGDLANIGRRGLWALAGMWLAASVFTVTGVYQTIDATLIKTTSQIQGGFISGEASKDQRDQLPNSLYDNVVYTNWLRGEFGDPNSDNAKRYGPQLLDDQAWTKTDVSSANDQAKVEAKANDYKALPDKLGTDKGFFMGTDGSRTGSGFLAMFQGFAYALFQLLAKAAVLLAQVLIRILILASPLIGLVAMVMPDLLRKVARAAGAVLLLVLAFSAMAGAHALLLQQIFDASNKLSLIAQMLLATLITGIFLLIGKPVRRMRQMVELAVGGNGLATPFGRGLFNRFRTRGGEHSASPQEAFWDNVSGAGEGTPDVPLLGRGMRGRRGRPEGVHGGTAGAATGAAAGAAAGMMTATATRLDTDKAAERANALGAQARTGIGGIGAAAAYPAYRGPSTALLPAGASRVTDSFPTVDSAWDNDESVVVPSSVVTPSGKPVTARATQPRATEPELVGGEQVYVLYRPSRGFETGDGHSARGNGRQ